MLTWKHKNPIDSKEMGSSNLSMLPKGANVQWFAIDEYNLGSFATYTSKRDYYGYKAEPDALTQKHLLQWRLKRLSMQLDQSM